MGDALGVGPGHGQHLVGGDGPVDEPELGRLDPGHAVAGKEPLLGAAHAQMDRPHAEGVDLTHRAGLGLTELGVVGGEDDVEDAGQVEAAGHARALHDADRRLPDAPEPHPTLTRLMELPARKDGSPAVRPGVFLA